jgi:hypothetical protein
VNACPQKKLRRKPGTLEDTFASWTPVDNADLAEVHAIADTVSTLLSLIKSFCRSEKHSLWQDKFSQNKTRCEC